LERQTIVPFWRSEEFSKGKNNVLRLSVSDRQSFCNNEVRNVRKREGIYIFLAAVGFRLFMYLAAALIIIIKDGSLSLDSYLANWCRWDAQHYLNIAKNGYGGAVEVCDVCRNALLSKGVPPSVMEKGQHLFLVFFPLFPLALKLFGLITMDLRLAGLVVSTLAYGGGCVYMYRLVRVDYSKRVVVNSIILLSLFPFGFFFGGIMSEGLFFLVSAGTLYYIRRHKWWSVILFGCLASMCRMQGALLLIPAGIELLQVYKPLNMLREKTYVKMREMIFKGISLFLMLTGTGVYLLINWNVEKYPFSFMVYQKSHWNNGICLPTKTVSYVFQNAFSSNYDLQMRFFLWMPQAVLAAVSAITLLWGIKRLRPAYMGYAVSYVLLTYSSMWLLSAGRYLSCCIPLFIVPSVIGEKKRWIMPVLTLVFIVLHSIYLCGYLNGMHIM